MKRPLMKHNLLIPFSIGHFANDLVPTAMYILIPAYGFAHGLSPSEIGLLFMIQSFGFAVAYFPAGLLADHMANRGVLLVITFFWVSFGYLVASFADGFWTFAFLIALAGMGDAAWHPIATGVLAQIYKTKRAYALGMHAVGGHLSEVIVLPVTGLLLTIGDWRLAIQLLIIPTFLAGCYFLTVAPKVPRHVNSRPTRADFANIWQVWTTRAGVRMIALFTTYNMSLFALITMTPLYLKASLEFGWQETGILLSLMLLSGALVQPMMGKISDNIGRRPLIISGNVIATAATFIAWLSSSVVLTLVAIGVALTVLVAIRSVLLAAAVDHAGGREGTSLGIAFAFMDGFAATAAVLAGLAGESDLTNAFLLASGFSLIAVCFAIATPRRVASLTG